MGSADFLSDYRGSTPLRTPPSLPMIRSHPAIGRAAKKTERSRLPRHGTDRGHGLHGFRMRNLQQGTHSFPRNETPLSIGRGPLSRLLLRRIAPAGEITLGADVEDLAGLVEDLQQGGFHLSAAEVAGDLHSQHGEPDESHDAHSRAAAPGFQAGGLIHPPGPPVEPEDSPR